jgi:transcriptional regulator with XRE-family HTH domain
MPQKSLTIAELLAKIRKTQTEFAEEMGVSLQSVNKWISGKATPAVRHCRIIEAKYGVKLVYRGGKNGN